MNKPILLEKILTRATKEYGSYNIFREKYNRQKTYELYYKYLKYPNAYYSLSSLFDYDDWIGHNLFDFGDTYGKEINNIIFDCISKVIDDFLNKHNIKEIFNNNIAYGEKCLNFKYSVENVYELIEALKEKEISAIEMFTYSFIWRETEQKHNFWKELNNEYKKFVLNLLFNE